ncbi:hypothetical protein [Methylibium sp.]|uniref:hypothetical protein n=1 Tax=Methylibium sp. TaxID=2067992 RepID=UPI003D150EB9
MFRLTQSPTYFWPVEFELPDEDQPGKFVKHGFDAMYARLDVDAHQALIDETMNKALSDCEFARRVLRGWRNVLEDDGKTQMPFSAAKLDQLLKVTNVGTAIAKGYMESRGVIVEKK